MHVLFIIDALEGLNAYKDSSVAMMRALSARSHAISVAMMGDLALEEGEVRARVQAVDLVAGADLHGKGWWQAQGAAHERSLAAFDAVLMRKDPPFDMEYLYATHLLDQAEAHGARVFNSGVAIRQHPEKLAIAEFPEYIAPTLVARDMDRLRAFHDAHHDIVVKPLDGMGGTGIFRLRPQEVNVGAILETLTDNGTRTIMAQRYLPDIVQGDKRVLIIGGKPIDYALARIPKAGETRGNLAAGGRGVAQALNAHDRGMAEAIGAKLAPRGLLLIGLDVIGTHVTEINVTSPTCFVEITEQTGFDVADHFVAALERAVAAPPSSPSSPSTLAAA